MASRLLHRLRRSFFKDGHEAELEQEEVEPQEEEDCDCEAELEEEEECVTDRLGGTLCFDSRDGGPEEGGEGDRSGLDSDSDFLGESMEEGLSSADTSPGGVSPVGPASLLTRHFQDSWRRLSGVSGASSSPTGRRPADSLLFEVTDASVVQDGSSKFVLYTIHVIQAGGSDKTPAVITRRYSDFRRLHATLCRDHGALMERVCFPRKKLRRNFTAETIAKRSRAFEQYLFHLCSLSVLQKALCVRLFFYLDDLQAGQLLIRVGRYQDALGPLLNAKRLQNKLGWTSNWDVEAQARPGSSSHWFFTLVGLLICFQEVDQLEDARDHCDEALHVLVPAESLSSAERKSSSGPKEGRSQSGGGTKSHPVLVPLLQAMVRLSWQTGKDKRQWEELMHLLEEKGAELDNQPSIKEFLVTFNLEEQEGNC